MHGQINRLRYARPRCSVDGLERRCLLSAVVVNTIIDGLFPPSTGVVSLRNAIAIANSSSASTTITFDPNVFATLQTINLNGTGLVLNGSQSITITGPEAGLIINGSALASVFQISAGSVSLSRLTLTNGSGGGGTGNAGLGGGAVYNGGTLTLTDVNITGNAANYGGGINNNGTATLLDVIISNNTATYGGGIGGAGSALLTNVTISGNTATWGAGINNNGAVTLTNVALSGNHGSYGGGIDNGAGRAVLTNVSIISNTAVNGGGFENSDGTAVLVDVTASANSAAYGGGIDNGGTLTIINSTISGNTATGAGGGIYHRPGYSTTIGNSIIGGNALSGTGGSGPDASGSFNSLGFNLVGKTDGSTGWNAGDLTGTTLQPLDPKLSALGDYGGPTATMVPLPGSPAIDAGWNALAVDANDKPLTTDQRGYARIYNGTVDIGAVEFQAQVINEASTDDVITLERDMDQRYIDWTVGSASGRLIADDPEGAIVNGNGDNDPIALNYACGKPLPGTLNLNGTFTIAGLADLNGTKLNLNQGKAYITYPASSDPIGLIRQYVANGYDGGAWNGTPTASTGVIASSALQTGANAAFGIGLADSADSVVPGLPANTIELLYTLKGDVNLDRAVNLSDLLLLARHFGQSSASWDQGDLNYDSTVNFADLLMLAHAYGMSMTTPTVTTASASAALMASLEAGNSERHSRPAHRRGPMPSQRSQRARRPQRRGIGQATQV